MFYGGYEPGRLLALSPDFCMSKAAKKRKRSRVAGYLKVIVLRLQEWEKHCGLYVCGECSPWTHKSSREPSQGLYSLWQGQRMVAARSGALILPCTPCHSALST